MDNHAPKMIKRIKGRRYQWLSTEIKKFMDEGDKMLRKDRRQSNYKQLKNQYNNMIKYAKRKYHNNLIANNSKNTKAFWKAVTPSSIPEKISKANNFCSYFSLVAESLKTSAYPLKNFIWLSQLNQLKKSI